MEATAFTAEFKAAFRLVAEHYRCTEDEIREMKAAARADIENATRCFLALEREILGPAKGINERIRDAIAKKGGMGGDMAVTSRPPIDAGKVTTRSLNVSTSSTDAQ